MSYGTVEGAFTAPFLYILRSVFALLLTAILPVLSTKESVNLACEHIDLPKPLHPDAHLFACWRYVQV